MGDSAQWCLGLVYCYTKCYFISIDLCYACPQLTPTETRQSALVCAHSTAGAPKLRYPWREIIII